MKLTSDPAGLIDKPDVVTKRCLIFSTAVTGVICIVLPMNENIIWQVRTSPETKKYILYSPNPHAFNLSKVWDWHSVIVDLVNHIFLL